MNYPVSILSTNTSGARVRFRTDDEKDVVINFPLYNDLADLYIGLQEGATLAEGSKYRYEKPILYYGSSITQGGCASRPGNCYQSIISRRFDVDFLNFGYSSGGCGEENIITYLAQLDSSIFVMDYDYNTHSQEHLAKTHPRALEIIREFKPDLPVIMISKPDIRLDNEDDIKRRDIIISTYSRALANGDKNLYFIDGYSLFGGEGHDSCTVDGAHPNDLGFW